MFAHFRPSLLRVLVAGKVFSSASLPPQSHFCAAPVVHVCIEAKSIHRHHSRTEFRFVDCLLCLSLMFLSFSLNDRPLPAHCPALQLRHHPRRYIRIQHHLRAHLLHLALSPSAKYIHQHHHMHRSTLSSSKHTRMSRASSSTSNNGVVASSPGNVQLADLIILASPSVAKAQLRSSHAHAAPMTIIRLFTAHMTPAISHTPAKHLLHVRPSTSRCTITLMLFSRMSG